LENRNVPIAIRVCILTLLLVMAASSMAAIEDDWSVLTEAEIREALGVGDHDAGMTPPRPMRAWVLLAWAAGGVLAAVWFGWRTLRRALWFRKYGERPPTYRRWVWFLIAPPMVVLLLPLPWTLVILWSELTLEARTWWLYYSGRPLVLQGIVRHTETREPIPGVWVRYILTPYNRFSNRPSSCRYDLVLRTNEDGRWRVELPPKAFAAWMANHGDVDPRPRNFFAPGLQHDLRYMYTEEEARLIDIGRGMHIIDRELRATKGDEQAWMKPAPSVFARLRPGVDQFSCKGDSVKAAGPRAEMMRAVLREQRDLLCEGPPDDGPWPKERGWTFPFTGLPKEMLDKYQALTARLEGLERGTIEYDATLCGILKELEP
jgi:hypothetical protein